MLVSEKRAEKARSWKIVVQRFCYECYLPPISWSSIDATKMIYHEVHEGHEEKIELTTDYADFADYFETG